MALPYYRWFTARYVLKTMHLSVTQDCMYRRLIDAYMNNEGPLPNDIKRLCGTVRALTVEDQQAVEFVLVEFFELDRNAIAGMQWRHKHCDEELKYQSERSESAKVGAKSRWGKKKSPHANALRSQSIGNATKTETKTEITSKASSQGEEILTTKYTGGGR